MLPGLIFFSDQAILISEVSADVKALMIGILPNVKLLSSWL